MINGPFNVLCFNGGEKKQRKSASSSIAKKLLANLKNISILGSYDKNCKLQNLFMNSNHVLETALVKGTPEQGGPWAPVFKSII